MNHKATEVTEKKKRKNKASRIKRMLPYVLVSPFICGFIFWLIPILNVGLHYVRWQVTKPEQYNVNLGYDGMIYIPELAPVEVGAMNTNYPDNEIAYMFGQAFWCKANPIRALICQVTYNSEFGFPEKVSWYFLEGGWIYADSFTVIGD